MKKIFVLIVGLIFFLKLNAQVFEQQRLMAEYKDNEVLFIKRAEKMLRKCIRQNKVYIRDVENVNFDSIEFIVIPCYKVDKKKYKNYSFDKDFSQTLTIDKNKKPFDILLIKKGEFYGFIKTDDCNNTYVDINYNYRYEESGTPLYNLIKELNADLLFELGDYKLFIKDDYLRIINKYSFQINYDENFIDLFPIANEYYAKFEKHGKIQQTLFKRVKYCEYTRKKLHIPWYEIEYGK